MFVTASHQFLKRPQDAMAIWIEDLNKVSFKICLRETKIYDGTHKDIKIVSELHFLSMVLNKANSMLTVLFNYFAELDGIYRTKP